MNRLCEWRARETVYNSYAYFRLRKDYIILKNSWMFFLDSEAASYSIDLTTYLTISELYCRLIFAGQEKKTRQNSDTKGKHLIFFSLHTVLIELEGWLWAWMERGQGVKVVAPAPLFKFYEKVKKDCFLFNELVQRTIPIINFNTIFLNQFFFLNLLQIY